jgi:phage terminase small subunit
MAAKPKLTPQQWAQARNHWELDRREGYAWLVEELGLPVSAPGVRKTALRDGWLKKAPLHLPGEKPTAKAGQPKQPKEEGSARKVSKVSAKRETNSETNSETKARKTIETLPETMAEKLERDPDEFGVFDDLTDQQEMFVREYMVDLNATGAAIRAGYSAKSAMSLGCQLLKNPKIDSAVKLLHSARAKRIGLESDDLMRSWSAILTLDANEIAQLRRVCCAYCWGSEHQRQYTPSGLEEAKTKHARERARRMKADENDDIGEFPEYVDAWYDKRKAPHEDCPECHGEGVADVFFNDTRNLSPAARLVYSGIKAGKDGIEVLTMSKEKAADNLARALGMFKDKETEVTINMMQGDELCRIYETRMQQARERQALVLAERGIVDGERR